MLVQEMSGSGRARVGFKLQCRQGLVPVETSDEAGVCMFTNASVYSGLPPWQDSCLQFASC